MPNFPVERQAILVLGMHRSGTSALTRVINLLGFSLPRHLIPPSQYNVKGFWETQSVVDFHDRVLTSAGSYWHDWSRFNPDWYSAPLLTAHLEELKAILLAEFGTAGPIVVKDPRICRLLPLWLNVFDALQIAPTVIVPFRNPLEVARSLHQRDGFTEGKSFLLWLRHVLDAEQASRHLPRAFCSYEELLLDWRRLMDRIGRQASLVWSRLSVDTELEITEFLSAEVRHQVVSDQDLTNRMGIPWWVSETYAICQLLSEDPQDTVAQQRLDAIRQEFDQGCRLFGIAVRAEEREADHQRHKVADLEAEMASLRSDLENTRQQANAFREVIQEKIADVARLQEDMDGVQRHLEESREALQERAAEATHRAYELENSRQKSVVLATELNAIKNSVAWRLTTPLRSAGTHLPWLETRLRPIVAGALNGLSPRTIRLDRLTTRGQLDFKERMPDARSPLAPDDPYAAWLRVNQWNPRAESEIYYRLAAHRSRLPKISVVMPVYNPPMRFFIRAIESVKRQIHTDWELCIADDASTDPQVRPYLEQLAQDPRIAVHFREVNGHISAATNSAAGLAKGDFLLLVDQDDELTLDALAEVALYIADHPETDLLYSDCDKIDEEGRRYDPHFKPDWSPELLLSYMYAGQVLVVRSGLFEQLGGLREGFEGSQDHDFALRAGELARHVGHLPYVLYHWRCVRGSTAFSGHEKPYSFTAGLKAVQSALDRRGSKGQAYQPDWAKRNGNGIYYIRFPDEGPSVTLIIPTHNRPDLLRCCLKSLNKTTYRHYRVMVVDNENDQPEARRYLDSLNQEVIRIANRPGQGFSFSYVMNQAAQHAATEYLLFLNDDTEIVTPEWLSNMVGYAELSKVGAVGALLRYKDGRVQHAGVAQGIDGLCDHAFKLTRRGDNGYLAYIAMARNCAAVTAACLLTRRQLFLEVGGFDEEQFPVAYNDPDYCHRLRERGYRVVYTPNAELLHFEGQTRGFSDRPQEIAAYRKRFNLVRDPYLNPNLSRENPNFQIAPRRLIRDTGLKLRAAMFTHNLNWEGAPRQMLEIAKFLQKNTHITPLIFSPHDGPLRESYEQSGIEVKILSHPLSKHNSLPGYLEALGEIGLLLAESAIDIVFANTLHGFFAIDVAHQVQLPCLWVIHESEGWQNYFDFVPPAIRSRPIECFKYPYRVIFVAKQTRNIYRELDFCHNFTVIPNGLEPDSIASLSETDRQSARSALGINDNDIVILSVGTVCDRKRQIDLVEALSRLDKVTLEAQQLRFFIVGDRDNEYSQQLHVAVERLEPARRALLTIIKETSDVILYYRASDIFVLTSGMESYPRVILEAMSAGLAILTTPVNGVVEQVREGINADYYSVGDIGKLTARLTALIQDRPRRERYRAASPWVLQGLTGYAEMGTDYAELLYEAALASVADV